MSLKIGLTGGIGSGKSTAAKIFSVLHVPVYDADAAAKRLYHTDSELKAAMQANFGKDIYVSDVLNRQKLAQIVFNNPQKLELLNRLVHPLTIRDAELWMKKQTAPFIIKEAALLFESGSAAGLDYVIGVFAPKSLRIKRVIDRDKTTRDEVLARMSRQIDESIKMRLCDFRLINDEQTLLIPQILHLHEQLLSIAAD